MKHVALLVEGSLDETVGRRVVEEAGGKVTVVYGKAGSGYIKKKIGGFNQLAAGIPVLALADLMDTGSDCPARVVEEWIPHQNKNMLFRLVVREIESWIMADRANTARFLGVPKNKVPRHPERLDDPKRHVINLARQSRHGRVLRLLVPREGSTATEGPAYTSEMQKFVRGDWDVEEAAGRSESLNRCMGAVVKLFSRS